VSNELYLLKDGILLAALIAFSMTSGFGSHVNRFIRPGEMLLWVAWILLFVVGFALTTPSLSSVAGLRYYLAPLPLLVVVPLAFANLDNVQLYMKRYLVLCYGVCLLGTVQALSPPEAPINVYAWQPGAASVDTFGDVGEAGAGSAFSLVRITGTFSYMSTYTAYLQFMFFATVALFLCARGSREKMFTAGGAALILVNMTMTGGRAPVLTSLLLLTLFVGFFLRARSRAQGLYGAALIAAGVVGIAFFYFMPIFESLLQRNEQAGDAVERMLGALLMPYYTIVNSNVIGAGVGETFLGIGEATAAQVYREMNFAEVSEDRIALEIGTLGYMFVLLVKVFFVIQAFRLRRTAISPAVRIWATVALAYQLSFVWVIPVYNAVAASFYFASLGLVGLLRAQNQAQLRSARAAQYGGASRLATQY
jgi:hypothetical protein